MTTQAVPSTLRVGLVTMCASRDVEENVRDATALVRQAAAQGAQYVQTPEFTTLMEMQSAKLFAATKSEAETPAVSQFAALARELQITLHVGSMGVLIKPGRIANRSYLFSPAGEIVARYDKIHMFDAALGGGENFRESKNFEPGGQAVIAEMPWGSIGLTVCYDLRFPGLYRALAKGGAQILAVPSAFARQTGEAHWHPLLKARAIECGAWVLAAAQAGRHACGRDTFGHAIVINPWGEVVAEADVHPSVIVHDVQLGAVAAVRQRLPSLEHDRPFAVEHVRSG